MLNNKIDDFVLNEKQGISMLNRYTNMDNAFGDDFEAIKIDQSHINSLNVINVFKNYFNEDNAVKFDLQNGKIETLCFCRDKHLAEEIALALNKYNDEDNE